MKKLFLLLCLLASLVACKKAKELLDITFRSTLTNDFTLPKITDREYAVPDTLVPVRTPDIVNTIPEEFKKNNADINKVKSVTIEGIDLAIKSPANQNFGFMKSIKVYLGAPGLAETLIATKDNINSINPPPTTLSLDAANADIVNYIKGPTYYLRIETVLVRTYTQDILIGSNIRIKAVANPVN